MKHTILILFLFLSLSAKDFSIIIEKPFNEALFDITQDYDRSISAVGFTTEYKQTSNTNTTYTNAFDYLSSLSGSGGSRIALVKVDKNAKLIDKEIKLEQFSQAVAVVKTSSNGYFVGGHTTNGSLLLMKLDSQANIIFSRVFGTSNNDKMSNLILLRDGGVLAIGSAITSRSSNDNIFESGLGLNDIYLTRFSNNGKKLWTKKYGTQHDDTGIDAVEAQDGSIIVVGKTSYKQHNDVSLMRISENGTKIWLKHFKKESKLTPYKILKLRDNNFLLSLSQQNEMNKEQIRLIKFNLQKNVLIDKLIVTSYSSALKDIKEYSDGTIIGVGYVKDTYNTDALVMMLNNTLNMLNQEHYGDENFDIFHAVTIMHNSQAAVAGLNTNPISQESNMWIAKINRDATMAQVSTKIEDFYIALKKIFSDEIRMGTLKIKDDLSLELLDPKLQFNTGEYKLNATQTNFLNMFAKKLIPFLYKNKNYIKTLEVNGHTSSEWNNSNFSTGYLKNEKLSMRRSFSTLTHIFKSQDLPTQKWLSQVFKGSGLAFSKKIIFDSVEYKQKSRRVSFKLIL